MKTRGARDQTTVLLIDRYVTTEGSLGAQSRHRDKGEVVKGFIELIFEGIQSLVGEGSTERQADVQ